MPTWALLLLLTLLLLVLLPLSAHPEDAPEEDTLEDTLEALLRHGLLRGRLALLRDGALALKGQQDRIARVLGWSSKSGIKTCFLSRVDNCEVSCNLVLL